MDSELSHDPYAPEGTNAMTDFDTARWNRAGATDDELAVLAAEHAALTEPERAGMNGWMTSVSDPDLRAALEARREAEPDGFVNAAEQPAAEPDAVADVEPTPSHRRGTHRAPESVEPTPDGE